MCGGLLQYARSRDSDDESESPSGGFPAYRHDDVSPKQRHDAGKKKVCWMPGWQRMVIEFLCV